MGDAEKAAEILEQFPKLPAQHKELLDLPEPLPVKQETVRLKKSKLRYIARRSGQPLEKLQQMLDVVELQGRRVSVTYNVVATRRGDPIGRVKGPLGAKPGKIVASEDA